MSDRSTPE